MTLLDDVARAIKAEQLANLSVCHNPGQIDEAKLARAALAVFARYLRDFGHQQDSEYRGYCNALASHLEKEMG